MLDRLLWLDELVELLLDVLLGELVDWLEDDVDSELLVLVDFELLELLLDGLLDELLLDWLLSEVLELLDPLVD